MNILRRAIAVQPLFPTYSSRNRLRVLYPISVVYNSSFYSTSRTATTYATTKYKFTPKKSKTPAPEPSTSPSTATNPDVVEKAPPVDWARPSEIPYQAKVANSVNLIGYVHIPVQFKATEDGNYWAGTVIAQHLSSQPSSSPSVWIPIVFEGDLAHIANCHLKEKDYVYIAGELCTNQPPLTWSQGQTNVQVMVHNLNFVEVPSKSTKSSISQAADVSPIQSEKHKVSNSPEPISLYQQTSENLQQKKTSHSDNTRKRGNSSVGSWRDLLQDPKQWCDYRESKRNGRVKPTHPDFKHIGSGVGLWLDKAPGGVLAGLGALSFNVKPGQDERDGDPWRDLVSNPDEWWDNRSKKVNKRSPDFKHKETGKALWLSDSPSWVSSSLPPLEAKQATTLDLKEKQNDATGKDSDSWRDLVENPKMWWDNRSNKLNPRSPDFKHKDTAKGLWITDAPAWALPDLPPSKTTDADVKEGDPWKDLVEKPEQWWDRRSNKVNAKAPDFKNKDTGKALWLSAAPAWVLRSLPPLKLRETDGGGSDLDKKKDIDAVACEGDPWKDLAENPKKWWDNRSRKVNEKSPDFKHKDTGKALWLTDVPEWVISSLPPLNARKIEGF